MIIMKKILITFAAVLFGLCSWGQNPTLVLESSQYSVAVGEQLTLSLKIVDPNLPEIVKNMNYSVQDDLSFLSLFKMQTDENSDYQNAFVYTFNISPQKTGKCEIGPFKIKYQGKTLQSNVLTIDVTGVASAITITAPEKIEVNEPVTIELSGDSKSLSKISMIESEDYRVQSTSSSNSISITNGERVVTSTKKFVVKFLKSGTFAIDQSIFITNDGSEINIIPIYVEVVAKSTGVKL